MKLFLLAFLFLFCLNVTICSELPKMRASSKIERKIEFSIDGKKGAYELMGEADSNKINIKRFAYSQQLENDRSIQYLFSSSQDANSTAVRVEQFDGQKLTLSVQGTRDTLIFHDEEPLMDGWKAQIKAEKDRIILSFATEQATELRSRIDTLRLPLGQLCFTYEPAPPYAKIITISYPQFTLDMEDESTKTIGPVLYSKIELDSLARKNPYAEKIVMNLVPVTDYVMYPNPDGESERYAIKKGEKRYFQMNQGVIIKYIDNSGRANAFISGYFDPSESMPQIDRQIGYSSQNPLIEFILRFQLRLDKEGKYYVENDRFNEIVLHSLSNKFEINQKDLTSHFNPNDGLHTTIGNGDSLNKKPVLMKMYSETRDSFGDLSPHLKKYVPITSVHDNQQTIREAFIYPNPVTDYIEINLDKVILSEAKNPIHIYNTYGECVMTESIQPMTTSHRINIENLPAGIYLVRIGQQTAMFVKI